MSHSLNRRTFLLSAAALAACTPARTEEPMHPKTSSSDSTTRMPVLFLGHGSPMNAIENNVWSRAFTALGTSLSKELPKPRGVVAVSAHWFTHGTWVTGDDKPKTLHDFGGFPQELFEQQYPAPGDRALAAKVAKLVGKDASALRTDWGLDHGTWSVLKFLLPHADVPVIQLSIDGDQAGPAHVELGRKLAPLRDEGVLVIGSGNVTHNLRDAFSRMRSGNASHAKWADDFDAAVVTAIGQRDHAFLARAHESDQGRMAHPTPDHWLPLLYAAGASLDGDHVSYPIEGFDLGTLSMRAVRWG
jgi:4,5-DOPA dioxygenase extradiol